MAERNVTPGTLRLPIKPRYIVLIVIVLAVIGLLVSSIYTVDQTEKAVVLRFGKYLKTTDAGLHFKLPFGIDKNYNVSIKVQEEYFGYRTVKAAITSEFTKKPEESRMLTGDLNIIDVEWSIQYRIVDPKAWLFHVEYTTRTIRDISQSVINSLVGDRAIMDVLTTEREAIARMATVQMNNILNGYGLGIQVTQTQLQNTQPPQGPVLDSFNDVTIATQDMNTFINEGKEEYNRVIPQAKGEADKMIQQAQGYKAERVNRAKGDVARFNLIKSEYYRDPQITKTRLYLEMIEAVFVGEGTTELIDKNLSNFIPLMNLGQGGNQ